MCSSRRRRPALFVLLAAMAWATACSSAATRSAADFWSDAEPDPVLAFDPPLQLPAAATTFVDDFDAVVADQGPSRVAGAEYTLEMRTAAGDRIALHYRVGAHRTLPVQRGDKIHLTTWHRLASAHEVVARGLAITVLQGETPGSVVAMVDTQGVVPAARLPLALAAVKPTDIAAWQTAERVGSECDVAMAHQKFSLGSDPGNVAAGPRLLPPGARVRVTDSGTTYDLVLIDNRRVITSTCVPEPPAWWGWAAILVPGTGKPGLTPAPAPTRERAPPEEQPPGSERELPPD